MTEQLLCLYPEFRAAVPLRGLYLANRLHELGSATAPFVYANFLSSLDGRIALEDSAKNTPPYIPKHITTSSDFRLFMELHTQADCLITHGGYMRALSENRLGNILQVGSDEFSTWRRANDLAPQPAVIIASASLDFPMHPSLSVHNQQVYIATGRTADAERIEYWQQQGYRVLISGEENMVQGGELIRQLQQLGFRCIYLIAGPRMLDTMVREKQLSHLYLTMTHQLVGGLDFRTLLTGPVLTGGGDMTLQSLYYQQDIPADSGQFFMRFDLQSKAP